MKILALELSTARGSLAWLDTPQRWSMSRAAAGNGPSAPPNEELDFRDWPNDRKTSRTFFENLQLVTNKFGAPEVIAVGLGPGSYAGTRIAISAATGLQMSSAARLIGYPSICVMECDADEYCVIGDARRQSFFFARIRAHELLEGPDLLNEEMLKSKLAALQDDLPVFCSESLPQFQRAMIRYPSAAVLARLAQDTLQRFSLPPLEPMYLREPHITLPKTAKPK